MTSIESETDLQAMLYKKLKDIKAQSKLRITASSVLMRKKGIYCSRNIDVLQSMDDFYEA
jgi:hypothetical protein